MSPSHTKFDIAGLIVHVYGLQELPQDTREVAVSFLLHGRMGSVAASSGTISKLYNRASVSKGRLPLLLVAIDHRNHGHRLVERQRNLGWKEFPSKKGSNLLDNPTHALDMYSIQTGTAQDVSLLIDFLPAYLFPTDQIKIVRWICVGISLGGHSTWIAGGHDARLTHLCPVIGAPSLIDLMKNRANNNQLSFSPPLIPNSLISLCALKDPYNLPLTNYKDKKILALCGAVDTLVPYKQGKTEDFIDKLKAAGVEAELYVEPGCGHAFSPRMIEMAGDFISQACL